MGKCKACGTGLVSGAKFCHKCGASGENKCIDCGTERTGGAKFCHKCGASAAKRKRAVSRSDKVFTDRRDGQKYRTVRVGNFLWMAENLNYEIEGSWCYDNDKYGRYYTWNAAIEACPGGGWRLPGKEEWEDLIETAAGGEKLRSKTGWPSHYGAGTNDYGWSALPGGIIDEDGEITEVGKTGCWWSAKHCDLSDRSCCIKIGFGDYISYYDLAYTDQAISVRYVQD